MSTTCSTKLSDKLCPECKEINNTEVHLKEITITNKQTVSLSIPGYGSSSKTVEMKTTILQCPCCKTIYDEKVTTLTNKANWKSQYNSLMKEYDLGGEVPDYDGTGIQS